MTSGHPSGPQLRQPSKVPARRARENPAVSSPTQTPTLDGYRPNAPFLDELFEPGGTPRPAAQALVEELTRLGPEGLVEAGRRRDAIFMQQGITFETSGESGGAGGTLERPFPLDLVPRVLSARNGARSSAAWRSASAR